MTSQRERTWNGGCGSSSLARGRESVTQNLANCTGDCSVVNLSHDLSGKTGWVTKALILAAPAPSNTCSSKREIGVGIK